MCDKYEGRLIPSEVPNMHNYLKWEPFGVVALILPWNSPIGTLIWKLAPAIAIAGANFQISVPIGEFQGRISATTPNGSHFK